MTQEFNSMLDNVLDLRKEERYTLFHLQLVVAERSLRLPCTPNIVQKRAHKWQGSAKAWTSDPGRYLLIRPRSTFSTIGTHSWRHHK